MEGEGTTVDLVVNLLRPPIEEPLERRQQSKAVAVNANDGSRWFVLLI